MPLITQGKTNWKFLLIVIILAIIVGGGALWYAKKIVQPYQQIKIQKTEEKPTKTTIKEMLELHDVETLFQLEGVIKYDEDQTAFCEYWFREEQEEKSGICVFGDNLKDYKNKDVIIIGHYSGYDVARDPSDHFDITEIKGEKISVQEQGCLDSEGTVTTFLCCKSSDDFPNSCLIGACGCSPTDSHQVKTCYCGVDKCFDGTKCISKGETIDWIQEYFSRYRPQCNSIKDKYGYPNNYDNGDQDYPTGASKTEFYHFLSIPFNNSKKILRVYIPIKAGQLVDQLVRLIIYDKEKKTSNFIDDVKGNFGSNYGGIFVPYEIVNDDSGVILKACMGSPGAGGGSVNLGYKILSFGNKQLRWIAESGAYFYESFGKVVYTTEGENTPHYSKPGPSNNSKVVSYNILQDKKEIILEETDTSYEIINLYEDMYAVLNYKATKYIFSEKCPRQENAQFCAEKIITESYTQLP